MRLTLLPMAFAVVFACGDDSKTTPDAPKPPVDAPPDAMENPPLTLTDNEGGEIRLEWISQYNPTALAHQTTARATAYFYKSMTPSKFPIPAFPGCVDMRDKTKWPLAQGAITHLDVGNVIIASSGQDLVMTRDQSTTPVCPGNCDPFSRPHTLWYRKAANLPANDADTFLPPNEKYDIIFTGSSEWPAQVIKGVPFMPERWTVTSPPTDMTTMLQAGTDLTLTYTPVTSSNLPPGYRVNTFVAFQGTGHAGPIVACQEEGTDGSITVPAAMVDILRAYTPGRYVRQQLTHALFELTDGAPKPVAERKRVDVLTIYCYNTGWAAAP